MNTFNKLAALQILAMSAAAVDSGTGGGAVVEQPNPPADAANSGTTESNSKIVLSADAITEVEKKFGFRKTKDANGKEIPAPEPVTVKLKVLTLQGLVELLQSGNSKVQELLLDSVNTPIINQARDMIDEIGVEQVRAGGIPEDTYSFQKIAEMPPASKAAFDEDTWNAFKDDYVSVMQESGVTEQRAKLGAEILATRLNRVKSNKEALEQFRQRIQTWYGHSKKQDEFVKVYQYLIGRCEAFISANEPETILASF